MSGRQPTVEDKEILEVIMHHPDPVLSTSEVASDIDIGRQGTWSRLSDLEDRGLVTSKKIGRSTAWWITEDGEVCLRAEDSGAK